MGLPTSPRKIFNCYRNAKNKNSKNNFLEEGGPPTTRGRMMQGGESRRDATKQTLPFTRPKESEREVIQETPGDDTSRLMPKRWAMPGVNLKKWSKTEISVVLHLMAIPQDRLKGISKKVSKPWYPRNAMLLALLTHIFSNSVQKKRNEWMNKQMKTSHFANSSTFVVFWIICTVLINK